VTQIEALRALLLELGELFRAGLGGDSLPIIPPRFFAIGEEMPASRFSGSSRLRRHLKPKGRPRKAGALPARPQQPDVDAWILGRATIAFELGERALTEASTVSECMTAIRSSRA
jgi:hypothetical protein